MSTNSTTNQLGLTPTRMPKMRTSCMFLRVGISQW